MAKKAKTKRCSRQRVFASEIGEKHKRRLGYSKERGDRSKRK